MTSWKFSKDRMPHFSETCTISNIHHSLSALLFDKIWVGNRTKEESNDAFIDVPEEVTFGNRKIESEAIEIFKKKAIPFQNNIGVIVPFFFRGLAESFAKNGIIVTPTFESKQSFQYDYPDGNSLACQAVLNNIAIVDNNAISWNQVLEFRKDPEAARKYRSLRLWLHEGVEANSISHATDIIGNKIDDYEWAIKKHGLKTVTGILTSFFDLKTVSALATGAGFGAFAGGPVGASLIAGLIVTSKIVATVADKKIDLEDLKRDEYAPIALICEIKELLSKDTVPNKTINPTGR